MLGEAGRRPEVIDLIERETEGNVFFIVEVVRALAEEAGRLSDIGQVTLPQQVFAGGIQRVVLRRLNRVPTTDRPLLRLAAVAGRQLDPRVMGVLAAESLPGGNLDSWLTTCVNAAVLESQDGCWRFAHDKLREALLADLAAETRPAYSRQVAEALETVYEDHTDHAWHLTYLWAAAGDTAKEGHYAIIAAHQAARTSSYLDAVRLFNRALQLQAHEQEDNPRYTEANLYLELGRTHYSLSDYKPAHENAQRALDLFRAQDHLLGTADAISLLGQINIRQGNMEQAAAQVNDSLAMYRQTGNILYTGFGLMNRGLIENQMGEHEKARDTMLECYNCMIQTDDQVAVGRALNNLGIIYDMLGDTEQASAYHKRSLEIRQAVNDRHGIAYTLYNMAAMLDDQGQFERAIELFTESLKLLRIVGERRSIAVALWSLGSLTFRSGGDRQAAGKYFQESLTISQAMNNHSGVAQALTGLGEIAASAGDYTGAHQHYQEALRLEIDHQLDSNARFTALAIGDLRVHLGQMESGLALVGLIESEAGDNPMLKQAITRVVEQMRSAYPPDIIDAGLKHGAALDWATVLPTLLD
jgi:tetratricopeptide (TPR) repeat protein